jgi:hypothetical protein
VLLKLFTCHTCVLLEHHTCAAQVVTRMYHTCDTSCCGGGGGGGAGGGMTGWCMGHVGDGLAEGVRHEICTQQHADGLLCLWHLGSSCHDKHVCGAQTTCTRKGSGCLLAPHVPCGSSWCCGREAPWLSVCDARVFNVCAGGGGCKRQGRVPKAAVGLLVVLLLGKGVLSIRPT